MHVFVSTLSYTHTHTWHILFLLPFCSSLSHSLYNVYVCVYYVYVVCMHVYTMKYVKFFLTSPSLLFRIPLMFSLPCFFFRPSPLFSLVFSRFFFFFFFFSFDGENSKFPCVLPRGQPLVRSAAVGFPTPRKMCRKVSLVSISSSPRSVSFFVFAVLRGRFLIGAVWWNHSSFALSVFFEWSVTMIAGEGWIFGSSVGTTRESKSIVWNLIGRTAECSEFDLVNLRWMLEIFETQKNLWRFYKGCDKCFGTFTI